MDEQFVHALALGQQKHAAQAHIWRRERLGHDKLMKGTNFIRAIAAPTRHQSGLRINNEAGYSGC